MESDEREKSQAGIKKLFPRLLDVLGKLSSVVGGLMGAVWLWSCISPVMFRVSNLILSITTLGMGSLRDKIYADAAMGFHELPDLYLLLIVCVSVFNLALIMAIRLFRSPIEKCIENKINQTKPGKFIKSALFIINIAIALFPLFVFVNINEENLITTAFNQRITIIHPYISNSKYMQFQSKFAQIKTKKEYHELMSDIEQIGKENGLKLKSYEYDHLY
jgi:hypothetical protein